MFFRSEWNFYHYEVNLKRYDKKRKEKIVSYRGYIREKKMNRKELEKIKEKALEDHIPIIMDETLEVIVEL